MKLYPIFGNLSEVEPCHPSEAIDDDEQTVQASENRSEKGREMREFCVKWVYPMTNDKKKVLLSHHAILAMMLKENNDLIIIDNKGREHAEKKTMIPSKTHRPFEFYMDKRNKNGQKLVCIHRLRSKRPLAELKEAWGVLEELRKAKAYVRTHAFTENDREISHLGFIPGVNMLHTPKEVVKDQIVSMLKQEHQEVPNFEIVQVRVDTGNPNSSLARTRAYEIQCPYREASGLAKKLQSGIFKIDPVYIPYRLKKTDPKTFKNAIKRQIQILSEQWVIKLRGLTPTMISHINSTVMESQAEAIVPAPNKALGEWKILVSRHAYRKTIQWLSDNWEEIINKIPAQALEESNWERPQIVSKNFTTWETKSDEGTIDTYGTILSALYDGPEPEDEVQSDVSESEATTPDHTTQRPVTYANVTAGTTSNVSQVSGWTDQRNDEFAQLQDKHSHLEEKFNRVTTELEELKLLLHQILAQGKPQTIEEPPTKKQATFETPKRPDRRTQHDDNTICMELEPAEIGSETGQSQHAEK
jgi:hypothetical protein